jgi:hypothetical protein
VCAAGEVTAEMALASVARAESEPAEMPVTWVRPAILTGTGLSAVAPFPSWPNWPAPQANTMPSERRARPNLRPAEILVMRFSTATRAGATPSLVMMPRPQLAVVVLAPGPDRAVGPQGQAMDPPARDLHHVAACRDVVEQRPEDCGPVA